MEALAGAGLMNWLTPGTKPGPSTGILRARIIRRLGEDGLSGKVIAAQAECSVRTVGRVLTGEVYKAA
jgi:hypothetical protein